jgi:hypothetical protein
MKRRREAEAAGHGDSIVLRTSGEAIPIERGRLPSSSFTARGGGTSQNFRRGYSDRGGASGRGGAQLGYGARGASQFGFGARGGAQPGFRGGSNFGFRAAGSGGAFEPCWICGSEDHRRRDCPNKLEIDGHTIQKKLVCLKCRRLGHKASECTSASNTLLSSTSDVCFNCGEAGHSCFSCPKDKLGNGMTFASCFICEKKGHLAKQCEKNTSGVYPRGGSCKICGSIRHLARDCDAVQHVTITEVPESDLQHIEETVSESAGSGAHGQTRSFRTTVCGDDLSDSFAAPEAPDADADAADTSISSKKVKKRSKALR